MGIRKHLGICMDTNKANRTVADFAGWSIEEIRLDDLPIIWEKLEACGGKWQVYGSGYIYSICGLSSYGKSIKEAAIIATAKVILEMKNCT